MTSSHFLFLFNHFNCTRGLNGIKWHQFTAFFRYVEVFVAVLNHVLDEKKIHKSWETCQSGRIEPPQSISSMYQKVYLHTCIIKQQPVLFKKKTVAWMTWAKKKLIGRKKDRVSPSTVQRVRPFWCNVLFSRLWRFTCLRSAADSWCLVFFSFVCVFLTYQEV